MVDALDCVRMDLKARVDALLKHHAIRSAMTKVAVLVCELLEHPLHEPAMEFTRYVNDERSSLHVAQELLKAHQSVVGLNYRYTEVMHRSGDGDAMTWGPSIAPARWRG